MRRYWLWAGAGMAVLALAGRVLVDGLHAPAHPPQSQGSAAETEAARGSQSPAPPPAERPAQGLQFQALLLPDGNVGADSGSVRIGLGVVSPEDAAAYQDWVLGGGEGAGPSSIEELASVERWIAVPAQRLGDGSVRVGPVRLPDADRYELQAGAGDGLHYYMAAFAPDATPASIAPVVAAGLRVHRDPVSEGEAAVLLRRVEAGGAAAESWQRLMQREAPELLAAFDEDAIAVTRALQLAPLPPGPLEVVLRVDGVDAQTLPVTLVAGRVTDVRFDPLAQAVAHAVAIDLELEFVERGSGAAIEGLEVTWSGPRGEQARTSDTAGVVRFDGLDRLQAHRFTLHAAPPAGGLPAWPELQPLEIAFDQDGAEASVRVQRRRIEIARLEWIVARGVPPEAPAAARGSPYPIHVLQRERNGRWGDTAAAFFLPVADGLAVSVTERGVFRVATVLSPWRIQHSTATDTRLPAADGKYLVDMVDAPGHRADIAVLHEGVALANVQVRLRGPTRGLPPAVLGTDAEGHLLLEGVTVPTVWIEVADGPEQAIDTEGASTTIEVALPETSSDDHGDGA